MYFFISYGKKWLPIFRFAYLLHNVLESKKDEHKQIFEVRV